MEKDNRTWLSVREVLQHSLKIQSLSLWAIVVVLSYLESGSLENLIVIRPSGFAQVDWCISEFPQEVSNDLKSTSATKSLAGHDSSTLVFRVIPTKGHLSGTNYKLSDSLNRSVFFIKFGVIDNFLLNLLNYWENVWFAIVVSVCTNSQVYFLWIFVILEVSGERKNGISRSLLNMCKVINSEFSSLRD